MQLGRDQQAFFRSQTQASLGLASVHCAHSYLDIAVLGPGQCTEPVCLDIRRSGLFKGKNVSAAGKPVPQCNLPLSSVEMFALMSSYKKDVGVEAMGGLSDVFSKGSEHVKTSVARVRGSSRLRLSGVLGADCCSAHAAPASLRVYPPPAPPPPRCAQDKFSRVWTRLMGPNTNVFNFELSLAPVWPAGSGKAAPSVTLTLSDPIQLLFELLNDVHK